MCWPQQELGRGLTALAEGMFELAFSGGEMKHCSGGKELRRSAGQCCVLGEVITGGQGHRERCGEC